MAADGHTSGSRQTYFWQQAGIMLAADDILLAPGGHTELLAAGRNSFGSRRTYFRQQTDILLAVVYINWHQMDIILEADRHIICGRQT